MRWPPPILILALLAGPILAGCTQVPGVPDDEGLPRQFPRDIDAPAPEPVDDPPEFIDAPDPLDDRYRAQASNP